MNKFHNFIVLVLICLLVLSSSHLYSQQLSSYHLQNLPQRNYMNPAFAPAGKMHLGIPLLSGISYNYVNSGFKYSDLFRRNEKDVLILDIGNSIENMKDRNYISLNSEAELLSFGIKSGKSYFGLNVTEKASIDFTFTKSTMEFLFEGNAGSTGTIKELNPGLEAIHYREYGFVWSRDFGKLVTAGVRIKYLYGMEHAVTTGKGIEIYTDPVDFTITAKTDYTIFTSGIDNAAYDEFSISNYAFGKQNTGYGADAGIIFRPSSALEFSASITDIGSITWKTTNAIHHTATNNNDFVYTGIQLDEFINNDTLNGDAYLQNLVDSLYKTFNVTTTHESYKSKLSRNLYFSGSYLLSKRYKITTLLRHKSTSHANRTDYNVSFTGKSKEWLNYSIGVNKTADIPTTLGAGFTINFRNDQIYFVSDNIYGLINWKKSNNTGFRAGINLVFGTRIKKPKPPQPDLTEAVSKN